MPPSPPLSARITKVMYLMLMMMIERPEDQREQPVDVGGVDRQLVAVTAEGLAHGVQRAGADVAVHDAQRGERQAADAGSAVWSAVGPRSSDSVVRASGRRPAQQASPPWWSRALRRRSRRGRPAEHLTVAQNRHRTVVAHDDDRGSGDRRSCTDEPPCVACPGIPRLRSPPRRSGPAGPRDPQRAGRVEHRCPIDLGEYVAQRGEVGRSLDLERWWDRQALLEVGASSPSGR